MGNLACEVTVGFDKYWVVKLAHKAAFRIVDIEGDVVAEVSTTFSQIDFIYSLFWTILPL